jgi:uncharacterized protein YecE (DUF72 family)
MSHHPQLRVGISGWNYPPWRKDFYPEGLPHRLELEYAAERFTSIEINGSFYSLQRPSSYLAWRDRTPDDFVFSVKGPRFITHMKKLSDVDVPVANFLASGVLALEHKLGPILWQLPPNLGYSEDRMRAFYKLLPRTTIAASAVAERHDTTVPEDRAYLTTSADRPLRHTLEIRHPSLAAPDAIALAREYDVAMVIADTAGRWPMIDEITSDFVYVRLHGADELYTSGYTEAGLDRWAARVQSWLGQGLDCYVYFDNDAKVRAPYDAMALLGRLTSDVPHPTPTRNLVPTCRIGRRVVRPAGRSQLCRKLQNPPACRARRRTGRWVGAVDRRRRRARVRSRGRSQPECARSPPTPRT